MAKDKTTLRFWLRIDRPNKDKSCPVHLVYQIQSQRKFYAIPGIKLFPFNWDIKNKQAVYIDKKTAKLAALKHKVDFENVVIPTAADISDINAKLQTLRNDVSNIEKRFKLDQIAFSPDMVINALKEFKQPETKKDLPGINIVSFINRFAKDCKGTHKEGTLKVYTGLAAHLEKFETSRHLKVTFENIDKGMIKGFSSFLSETKYHTTAKGKVIERGINNITGAKLISTLKTILNYARNDYKINVNPDYRDYKVSRKDSDLEVITLSQDEFMLIYNLDLSENKRLDAVRDVFCFSCATGLRFSDLQQLRRQHIRKDHTIRMTASKTDQKLVIPLNPISFSILKKYEDRLMPLPIISNQKTNDYIKELGELAGINTPIEIVRKRGIKTITEVFKKYELLSIHVGRKSFITLSLEKGIAMQEVMALSGHTTYKAFKRYVDVSDTRKKTVMAEAWGKIESTNLKAV